VQTVKKKQVRQGAEEAVRSDCRILKTTVSLYEIKIEWEVRKISCKAHQYFLSSVNMILTCVKLTGQIANSNTQANMKKTLCKEVY
jgi:hypothetical protein